MTRSIRIVLLSLFLTTRGDAATAASVGSETAVPEVLAAGNVAEAEALARVALDRRARRRPAHPASVAGYADTLGMIFFAQGTPPALEAAGRFFQRALAEREKSLGRDHLEVAATLGTLAYLRSAQGRFAEALDVERRALAIRAGRRGERDPLIASSRRQIGSFLLDLGRYPEAEQEFRAALEIRQIAPADPALLADALNNMGEVSRIQDRFERAEGYFTEGVALADSALPPSAPIVAALINNLAGVHKDQARYDESEPLLERSLALRMAASAPDSGWIATACLNLAEVRRLQGHLEEAEPLYARALTGARHALPPGHPALGIFVNQAAVLYEELGDHQRAEPLFRESLGLIQATLGPDHPLVAQGLHDLAGLVAASGRRAVADSLYRRALRIREQRLGADHPEAAVTRLALARALGDDPASTDAEPLLTRALSVLDSSHAFPEARLDAYSLRAQFDDRAGRREEALVDLSRALAEMDSLRRHRGGGDAARARFVARQQENIDRLVRWNLEAGRVAEAFAAHERARARVLLDQIAASGVDLRRGIPEQTRASLTAAERAARERLARVQRRMGEAAWRPDWTEAQRLEQSALLETERQSAAADLQRVREAFKEASPLWRNLLSTGGRPASLAEVQRDLIPRRGLMLLYHVGPEGSFLFLIPPTPAPASAVPLRLDEEAARLFGRNAGPLRLEDLEQIVAGGSGRGGRQAGVAELLGGGADDPLTLLRLRAQREHGPDPLEQRLQALRRILMPDPLWPTVAAAEVAIIVPDGPLHLLPFDALALRVGGDGRSARYWLDEGPGLLYAPSATSMLSLTKRSEGRASPRRRAVEVLSVVNPAFAAPRADSAQRAPGTWRPLPWTAEEARSLRRAFARDQVVVLEGHQATERGVREAVAGKQFLHFATHGFVTEGRSEVLAGLVFAAPDDSTAGLEDDGQLQLFEIYDLGLECELAMLSACETHRGPRVAGEGVFALSRGFVAAGARRVIATLWPVRDRPTADLVGRLFTRIAAEERRGRPVDYALALRDAKRWLRKNDASSEPTHWAPFVLTGTP